MSTTRRKILTIGLILIVAGAFTIEQGPQFLSPIAQSVGFASHVQTVNLILPPTLLAVPSSNYTFLFSDLRGDVQVQGALEVTDGREIAFYVMDEGNFSLWRAGRPSAIILARPTAISYNFTFTPTTSGTYFFVFDNQDTSRRVVIFSLNAVENLTVLNPIVEFAGYEIFLVGFILSLFGISTGKKGETIPAEALGWKCRFCGAVNTGDQTFCEHCGRSQR
ncbi:MAG: zinc ribbon domain-containing protein [Candidatus Bathyarchaeia archaeon]